jgi:hypothetical protein
MFFGRDFMTFFRRDRPAPVTAVDSYGAIYYHGIIDGKRGTA